MNGFKHCSKSEFIVTARPNCSLTRKGRLLFFMAVGAVSFCIATAFALIGAWLVLPFAGLEILLLYWAIRLVGRTEGDYETIRVGDAHMHVALRQDNRVLYNDFPCCWAKVALRRLGKGNECKLFVGSHGKQVEVGQYITTEQRIELARLLRLELARCK